MTLYSLATLNLFGRQYVLEEQLNKIVYNYMTHILEKATLNKQPCI